MATTPVYIRASSSLTGLILKLAALPSVGDLDPSLANGSGDTLTELTNTLGWYKCDVTEALTGAYTGTVETAGGTVLSACRFDMADTTTPVFEIEFGMDSVAMSAAGNDAAATALLKLDWTGITSEAARSVLNAMRFLRNKWDVSGGTLTVKKEDDSTNAWTGTVSSDSDADPIIGSDPA